MHDAIQKLGEQFGYPDGLLEVLDELRLLLDRKFKGRLLSVILSGSAATGDFVWRREGDGITFLSDIDAVVIVASRESGDDIAAESQALRRISSASALFHVDVTVIPSSAIANIPHSFQAAEIRQSGWIVAGCDMRHVFPGDFRPGSSREAFFLNLWKPFLFRAVCLRRPDLYRQAIARQMMDLALLASSEQNCCVAGHRQRLEAFEALPEGHPLQRDDLKAALRMAYGVRQGQNFANGQLEEAQFLCLRAALEFLGIEYGAGSSAVEPARIQALLDPRPPRRIAGEIRNDLLGRRCDPAWIWRRKEACAGAALLDIYRCRREGIRLEPESNAGRWLGKFSGGPAPDLSRDDAEDRARRSYWEGEQRLHPGAIRNRDWVEAIMRGSDG
jgi:predicted nucleotidyltransferase